MKKEYDKMEKEWPLYRIPRRTFEKERKDQVLNVKISKVKQRIKCHQI